MTTRTDFELSRIYAQGWAAAGRLTDSQTDALGAQNVAALNPYIDKAGRERWDKGFARALDIPIGSTLRKPPDFKRTENP